MVPFPFIWISTWAVNWSYSNNSMTLPFQCLCSSNCHWVIPITLSLFFSSVLCGLTSYKLMLDSNSSHLHKMLSVCNASSGWQAEPTKIQDFFLGKWKNIVKMMLTFQRAIVVFTSVSSKFAIMLQFPDVLQMFNGVIVHTLVILFPCRDGWIHKFFISLHIAVDKRNWLLCPPKDKDQMVFLL